jgi:hypothetical protein
MAHGAHARHAACGHALAGHRARGSGGGATRGERTIQRYVSTEVGRVNCRASLRGQELTMGAGHR